MYLMEEEWKRSGRGRHNLELPKVEQRVFLVSSSYCRYTLWRYFKLDGVLWSVDGPCR